MSQRDFSDRYARKPYVLRTALGASRAIVTNAGRRNAGVSRTRLSSCQEILPWLSASNLNPESSRSTGGPASHTLVTATATDAGLRQPISNPAKARAPPHRPKRAISKYGCAKPSAGQRAVCQSSRYQPMYAVTGTTKTSAATTATTGDGSVAIFRLNELST